MNNSPACKELLISVLPVGKMSHVQKLVGQCFKNKGLVITFKTIKDNRSDLLYVFYKQNSTLLGPLSFSILSDPQNPDLFIHYYCQIRVS